MSRREVIEALRESLSWAQRCTYDCLRYGWRSRILMSFMHGTSFKDIVWEYTERIHPPHWLQNKHIHSHDFTRCQGAFDIASTSHVHVSLCAGTFTFPFPQTELGPPGLGRVYLFVASRIGQAHFTGPLGEGDSIEVLGEKGSISHSS